MTYKIIPPDKCDNSQLQAFYDLVVSGGQVMVEGYAVTKEEHRGKGISKELIKILMENSNSKSFYAPTKVDGMRHILGKIGFKKLGDNYQHDNKESITLYNYDEKK